MKSGPQFSWALGSIDFSAKGAGLGILPEFLLRDALTSNLLERLLPDWPTPLGAVYWVTPPKGPLPKRVEVLGEYLIEKLARGRVGGRSRARRVNPFQTHPRPPTICIDEFHPCRLEHAADGLIVDAGELGLAGGELGTADSCDPTAVTLASYSALQRISARAALIWALASGFGCMGSGCYVSDEFPAGREFSWEFFQFRGLLCDSYTDCSFPPIAWREIP